MNDRNAPTGPGRPAGRSFVNRALEVTGRTFVALGLLLLSFVAYQLWGTGIQQAQHQKELAAQFSRNTTAASNRPASQYDTAVLREGDVVGRISMPTIGVDTWMVAGSRLKDLEKGPGVFEQAALPGHLGNFAVAGHRTSYGAPFGDLDKLRKGDEITVTSQEGTFTYTVTGNEIVGPSDVSVLRTVDATRAVATLITCHPKWTSSQRLVVRAELTSQQTPIATPAVLDMPGTGTALEGNVTPGWFHDTSRVLPTLGWAVVLVLIWTTGVWFVRRLRTGDNGAGSTVPTRRDTVGGGLAVVALGALFLISLYVMFENLSGLLPANL